MKKNTVLVFIYLLVNLMVPFLSYGSDFRTQEQDEVQTLFSKITIKRISGFGGTTMSYSSLGGDFAFLMGGVGGVIVNNLFIGGYGEGLSNSIDVNSNVVIRDLDFGHGGFLVGYEIAHKAIVHPVISTRMGWGRISGENKTDNEFFYDNVFVVIPTISAEINLTRFFKVNIGAEYRQTLDVNHSPGMGNRDFSSFGVYMNFLFGWF